MAALQSKDRDTAQSAVEAMRTRLMPCISVLLNTCKGGGTEQDIQLADTIRNDWCSLLEEHLGKACDLHVKKVGLAFVVTCLLQ